MEQAKQSRKIFVIDTNVILHDSACITHFHEHDIVIPITVLEELDQFKKGTETLSYHAREFLRALDNLSGDGLFNAGKKIGPDQGLISIKLEKPFHDDLLKNFTAQKRDHHILNIAYHLAKENPAIEVILVTKDVNLRIKAKSIGILAQDYQSDHVKDLSMIYKGRRVEEHFNGSVIDAMYQAPYEVDAATVTLNPALFPNEFLIMRNGRKSALGYFHAGSGRIKKVDKQTVHGITPKNAEQIFALNALMNDDIGLVTISGKAGTGKTLLALAASLGCRHRYRQIFFARPVVPLSNKDLGYLPGDVQSKLDPYMQPLHDNLNVLEQNQQVAGNGNGDVKPARIRDLIENEKLVITPLSYIRGRSLVKVYFIIDESQNLTPHEVKTIITRAGERTKVILTGDIFQIDHPYLDSRSNGLSYLIEKMQGQPLYAHINLEKGERSELAELASNLL